MDDSSINLGGNLRKIRQERGLSLEETSALTGVSKAMLGQIERGESSPTVSLLWKIASGLKITFSSLMTASPSAYQSQSLEDTQPILEADGQLILYNLFPFDPMTGFDYFHIVIKPGCDYESPSHPNVREEFIVVTKGRMEVKIGDQIFTLSEGNSIRFQGNEAHTYRNPFAEEAIYQNIIKY